MMLLQYIFCTETNELLLSSEFMSSIYIVNIRLLMWVVFPQSELLVNLAVFNILVLADRADTAVYKQKRKGPETLGTANVLFHLFHQITFN